MVHAISRRQQECVYNAAFKRRLIFKLVLLSSATKISQIYITLIHGAWRNLSEDMVPGLILACACSTALFVGLPKRRLQSPSRHWSGCSAPTLFYSTRKALSEFQSNAISLLTEGKHWFAKSKGLVVLVGELNISQRFHVCMSLDFYPH